MFLPTKTFLFLLLFIPITFERLCGDKSLNVLQEKIVRFGIYQETPMTSNFNVYFSKSKRINLNISDSVTNNILKKKPNNCYCAKKMYHDRIGFQANFFLNIMCAFCCSA